jgi:hypothetical protein
VDISPFVGTPYNDANALSDFMMANSAAHRAVADEIVTSYGYSVSSVPAEHGGDLGEWLSTHYNVHRQEFNVLGLTNLPDLSTLDPKSEQQYHDWMQMHSNVHAQVNQALGLL